MNATTMYEAIARGIAAARAIDVSKDYDVAVSVVVALEAAGFKVVRAPKRSTQEAK